ncbi:MAG: hypothetical protein ABJQ26_06875 [Maricaulis sp.]|uniref:type IV secretory system conjugative DNA transfer family protein n=1 Tax=Maricaulis sp. TaxID=1486257 RepID=UPI003297E844
MPEDFLSEVAKWWREGVEAGRNSPSLGPKVGRGLFSNWFLTERERDIRDLVGLHERLRLRHAAMPALSLDAKSKVIGEILTGAFRISDARYNRPLLEAYYDLVDRILIEECYWCPEYDPGDIAGLPLSTRVELRAFLLRRNRLYDAFDKRLSILGTTLMTLGADIFDAVAEQVGLDESEEDARLWLDVPLAGAAEDAPALIEQVVRTVCSEQEPLYQHELAVDLREQFMRNLHVASGINPNDVSSTKPLLLPRAAEGQSPSELVETYLEYTPFQALFEAALPMPIPERVRSEHALIVGGSGHGKSQLLQKFIHHDLTSSGECPPGVIVIDSQGDLIHTISRLSLFDPEAADTLADRVILIDPNDVEFPVALNLFAFDAARLEGYDRANKERVLNSVIDLYDYFFSALLGAELTQKQGVVFRYLARLMLAIPNATIQTLRELMEDGKPFKPYMETLDGSAKRFFETEFFSRSFVATKTQILRRLWGVLANPVFERMFSHPENKIDLFDAMNEGKIVLINTAKDLLKSEGCSIFGRFFIAKIAQAALERATVSEADRRPCYVYIDEAHDYFDETLEHLFNQARKYRVGLHIAAQHLDQMPTRLRSTVLASTSLKFAGGVSAKDARALADDMRTDADFIRSMRKRRGQSEFAAYVKGRTEAALRMNVPLGAVNALPMLDDHQYQALIDANRKRFCATLDEVETIIAAPSAERPLNMEPMPQSKGEPGEEVLHVDQPLSEERTEIALPSVQPMVPPQGMLPKDEPDTLVEDVKETRRDEIDRYVAGVGGQQHRKLQQMVRELAQERGFKVTVEKPVLGGGGQVDVALEHERLSVGVEISISTNIDHERKNVVKCFEAGFDRVFLVVPDASKRARFSEIIGTTLADDQVAKFEALAINEVPGALDALAAQLSSTEEVIRGWRVRTHLKPISEEEAQHRRETLGKIIAETVGNKRCPTVD